jgi:hypothetical protein
MCNGTNTEKIIILNTLFTVSIRHKHFELKIKFFQEIDQKYVLQRAACKFNFVQCCVITVDARLNLCSKATDGTAT